MNQRILLPPEALRNHVRYFWIWENDASSDGAESFRPLPDGSPGLFFRQSSEFRFYDQDQKRLPDFFLYGQTVLHREIYTGKTFSAWGVCFWPHALKDIFGLDADALTDDCTDALPLLPASADFPAEPGDAEIQIQKLCGVLIGLINSNRFPSHALSRHAAVALIESGGNLPLGDLLDKLHISERSLERRFKSDIGISPKLFARICRFQRSLQQLTQGPYQKLSDVALENGYADQSHFIRVFREFTGQSPLQFEKNRAPEKLPPGN